ncbi:MAG: type II secretion system protein [Lachnospiraceae bacterium]|nr:type II secretion system protein [Lachnospiraceae bacterium]
MSEIDKREKNTDNRHTWLFLLETTVSLTIFALAAAVMLSVFVVSSKNQKEAEAIHMSNTKLQNVIEVIRSANSLDELNQMLVSEYGVDGSLEIPPSTDSSAKSDVVTIYMENKYLVKVECLGEDEGLYHFRTTLVNGKNDIEEVSIDHYMRGADNYATE